MSSGGIPGRPASAMASSFLLKDHPLGFLSGRWRGALLWLRLGHMRTPRLNIEAIDFPLYILAKDAGLPKKARACRVLSHHLVIGILIRPFRGSQALHIFV